jgi:hypothetical protein
MKTVADTAGAQLHAELEATALRYRGYNDGLEGISPRSVHPVYLAGYQRAKALRERGERA